MVQFVRRCKIDVLTNELLNVPESDNWKIPTFSRQNFLRVRFRSVFVNSAHVLTAVLQASELGVSQQSQSSRCRWNWPNVTGLAVWWRFHYNIYRIMQTSLCKPKNKDWGGCDTRCETWLIIDQHQIPPYICSRNVKFWNSPGWSPCNSKSSSILVKGSTGQNSISKAVFHLGSSVRERE